MEHLFRFQLEERIRALEAEVDRLKAKHEPFDTKRAEGGERRIRHVDGRITSYWPAGSFDVT